MNQKEFVMHVSLTEKLDQYVREKVANGYYNNASEVMREALREKIASEESAAAKLEALRTQIDIGWQQADNCEFAEFDPDAINFSLDAELNG